MPFSGFNTFAIFCRSKNSRVDEAIRLVRSENVYNAAHVFCFFKDLHTLREKFLKHTHYLPVAHQQRHCVTSASAFCHSAVANGLYTAAACLCSTLYSLDTSAAPYTVWGGFKKRARKGRGVRYCRLKRQYNNPLRDVEV